MNLILYTGGGVAVQRFGQTMLLLLIILYNSKILYFLGGVAYNPLTNISGKRTNYATAIEDAA